MAPLTRFPYILVAAKHYVLPRLHVLVEDCPDDWVSAFFQMAEVRFPESLSVIFIPEVPGGAIWIMSPDILYFTGNFGILRTTPTTVYFPVSNSLLLNLLVYNFAILIILPSIDADYRINAFSYYGFRVFTQG